MSRRAKTDRTRRRMFRPSARPFYVNDHRDKWERCYSAGRKAVLSGIPIDGCPYRQAEWRNAWLTGWINGCPQSARNAEARARWAARRKLGPEQTGHTMPRERGGWGRCLNQPIKKEALSVGHVRLFLKAWTQAPGGSQPPGCLQPNGRGLKLADDKNDG